MTPSRSQLKAMPEENPTPGTTSSRDASPAPHSFNQTNHPNHSPGRTSSYIPGYRCPFPLSPRHSLPRESPLHPGPGSTLNRKTNRNSLTSLSSRLGSVTPPAAAATSEASRGSALPAALC
ncbi:mCG1047862 [Mus musculus]|nr:mCG1047862 [Mus musculus]